MGSLHASILGRCLKRLIGATDAALRQISGIKKFESEQDSLLLIAFRLAERDIALSDGTRIHPGDTVLELHVWNEHFPRFPTRIGDFGWAARVQLQMRSSLYRLALRLRADRALDDVRALYTKPAISNCRPANALARLLLTTGFEHMPDAAPRRSCVLQFLDNFWVWLLTWAYNPRALMGWRFNRTRHEFWISRARFLALHGDRLGNDKDRGAEPFAPLQG